MDIELDTDKAKVWLDDLTLDRIINAVGKPLKSDRDMLRANLLVCLGRYAIASGPAQSKFVKDQSDRLNSIEKHARKLVALLKADDADLRIIRSLWPLGPERPAHLLPQIEFLVEMIRMRTKEKPGDIARRRKAHHGMSGSARQELVKALSGVYEKHFGEKAKINRNSSDGTLRSSSFLCFAHQVVGQAGIKCSDETIASYA